MYKYKELPNSDTINTNCKLWIQPDGLLFKEYVLFDIRTKQNIRNLKDFTHGTKQRTLSKISEIALPLEIIEDSQNRIIGYVMEYFPDACTLSDYLRNTRISDYEKKDVLIQLANVIQRLPHNVFIGDLHGRNVLVDQKNRIHIIDVDGFSQKHNQISCPVQHLLFSTRLKKYIHNRKFLISRNTDIFCFMNFLLSWLSGIDNIMYQYTTEAVLEYIDFLSMNSSNTELAHMLRRLYEPGKNYLSLELITRIDTPNIEAYHYETFLQKHGH